MIDPNNLESSKVDTTPTIDPVEVVRARLGELAKQYDAMEPQAYVEASAIKQVLDIFGDILDMIPFKK